MVCVNKIRRVAVPRTGTLELSRRIATGLCKLYLSERIILARDEQDSNPLIKKVFLISLGIASVCINTLTGCSQHLTCLWESLLSL